MVGGFVSYPLAAVGAIIIGLIESFGSFLFQCVEGGACIRRHHPDRAVALALCVGARRRRERGRIVVTRAFRSASCIALLAVAIAVALPLFVSTAHHHADELHRHLHADHARPCAAHRAAAASPRSGRRRLWASAPMRTAISDRRRCGLSPWIGLLGRHRADKRWSRWCSATSRCISAAIICR